MIRHIVLTKFRNPETEAPKAVELLMSLKDQIPEIRYLEVNCDELHSERSYDIALVTGFDSWEDLNTYQNHPAHLAVKQYIHAHRTGTVSADYEL